jgi:hypothetical protein
VLLHHEDYFFACSHAASCLFPCAVTSSLARRPFFFCFFLLSLSAPFFFSVAFCRALQSPVTSPARSVFFFFFICCRSADRQVIHSARALLFPCAVTFPWRAQCFVFFLLLPLCRLQRLPCPVTSRAQKIFFGLCMQRLFTFSCLVLHASGESFSGCACRVKSFLVCAPSFFVCCPVNSRCAHADFYYFSVRSLPWRTELFFACSRSVWSLQLCCARRLSLFIFSVQLLLLAPCIFSFFLASLKCRERRHFFLSSFLVAAQQNQLNWAMGAVELVLRTSSTAYIYLTLSPSLFPLHSLSPWSLHIL